MDKLSFQKLSFIIDKCHEVSIDFKDLQLDFYKYCYFMIFDREDIEMKIFEETNKDSDEISDEEFKKYEPEYLKGYTYNEKFRICMKLIDGMLDDEIMKTQYKKDYKCKYFKGV
jgi:hypothetical protein